MTATICVAPGCPNPAQPGNSRCPAHARQAWRNTNRKAELPTNWPALRKTVLDRDRYRCRCPGCPRCAGNPCTTQATDVHHTQRHNNDPATLVSLCKACHHYESSSTGGKNVQR